MLSECPDSLQTLPYIASELGLKLSRNEGHCCPVLDNNPGDIPLVTYEPITGVDRFDVFGIQECSSADWNAEFRVNLPIILVVCNGMS